MRGPTLSLLTRLLTLAAVLLVLRVIFSVLIGYRSYFPPDFNSEFLFGREVHFYGGYQWAFYPHIIAGPVTLLLGLLLMSERLRRTWPRWHRRLGRMQVIIILLIVVPSGLGMAMYPAAGPLAGVGLVLLAVLTGLTTAFGWRAAVQRRFREHRQWMWRSYLLLCSAVVIRVIGGVATVLGTTAWWIDPAAVWLSCLGPLVVFELLQWHRRRVGRPPASEFNAPPA